MNAIKEQAHARFGMSLPSVQANIKSWWGGITEEKIGRGS